MIPQPIQVSPTPMTPTPFFQQYGIGADYKRLRIAHPHPDDLLVDLEREFVDESPFEVEPLVAEPPMPDEVVHAEQREAAIVALDDDDLVPDEPDHLVIGPHVAEAVHEYTRREPFACVW